MKKLILLSLLLSGQLVSAQTIDSLPQWKITNYSTIHYDSLKIDDVVKDLQDEGFIMYYTDRNYYMGAKSKKAKDHWEIWQVTDVPGTPYGYEIDFSGFYTKQVNGKGSKEVIFSYSVDMGGTSGESKYISKSCWDIDSKTMLFDITYSVIESIWWAYDERDEFEYVNEKGDTLTDREAYNDGFEWSFQFTIEDQRLTMKDLKYRSWRDKTYAKNYQRIEINESGKVPPQELLDAIKLGVYLFKNDQFIRQRHIDR